MGMIGAFIKAVAGVTIGMVVSGLIAKYAALGQLQLGTFAIAYSDLISVALFLGIAFVTRNRAETIAQVFTIAAGSQIAFMLYKMLSASGLLGA